MMPWWQAAVLGLVQGLTEFIPVSSTAHLRIVPSLAGWSDPGAAFSAVIQLGTLAAVLAYFAGDVISLTRAGVSSLWSRSVRRSPEARLAWAIAAGNVPIVVFGLGFRGVIETQARSLLLIGIMLIAVAALLAFAERRAAARSARPIDMRELGLRRVLVIGLWQSLALIPGTSRSGATILGGLLLGMRRDDAARFSFLLGIPAILGSGLLQLEALISSDGAAGVLPLAVGLAVSAVTGYASIGFLLRFLKSHSTAAFIAYRLILGSAVIALWSTDMIR